MENSIVKGRAFAANLSAQVGQTVKLAGWVYHLRVHAKTTFLVLKDVTGLVQCVLETNLSESLNLKLDDCVELFGKVVPEPRSKQGFEVWIHEARVLNPSGQPLPFNSSSDLAPISQEILINNRPLVLRSERSGEIFKLQAHIVNLFREYLTKNYFTEIFTSKIVASGTEGGTNLFKLKYFEKTAYLAQSPQFYKEHGVGGLERVFETAHVYRAEPHATTRHLTEYYSLDVEMGFIEGPEDVIELERGLLNNMFEEINSSGRLQKLNVPELPSMANAPIWEFQECVERLQKAFGRTGLTEDLDPEAERQLCQLAQEEFGVPAVFVLGFPLRARPFYTAPRGEKGAAQSFDLLFRGLEITTGGQRLHKRADLEAALRKKGIEPSNFESHLRMFELGMPPHGGFAIGAERLTAQILGINNIREVTMYPRDRNRITP